MVSQDSTCTAARERLLQLLLLTAESKERRLGVCGIKFKPASKWSGNQNNDFVPIRTPEPHPKHPRLKKHFFSSRNPMHLVAAAINTNGDTSDMPSMQPKAPTHLPAGIEGVRTHASTSLLRMSTGVFFVANKCDWRSRSLKKTC